jgi:hypothetical protein
VPQAEEHPVHPILYVWIERAAAGDFDVMRGKLSAPRHLRAEKLNEAVELSHGEARARDHVCVIPLTLLIVELLRILMVDVHVQTESQSVVCVEEIPDGALIRQPGTTQRDGVKVMPPPPPPPPIRGVRSFDDWTQFLSSSATQKRDGDRRGSYNLVAPSLVSHAEMSRHFQWGQFLLVPNGLPATTSRGARWRRLMSARGTVLGAGAAALVLAYGAAKLYWGWGGASTETATRERRGRRKAREVAAGDEVLPPRVCARAHMGCLLTHYLLLLLCERVAQAAGERRADKPAAVAEDEEGAGGELEAQDAPVTPQRQKDAGLFHDLLHVYAGSPANETAGAERPKLRTLVGLEAAAHACLAHAAATRSSSKPRESARTDVEDAPEDAGRGGERSSAQSDWEGEAKRTGKKKGGGAELRGLRSWLAAAYPQPLCIHPPCHVPLIVVSVCRPRSAAAAPPAHQGIGRLFAGGHWLRRQPRPCVRSRKRRGKHVGRRQDGR